MSLGDSRSLALILSGTASVWPTAYDILAWLALGGLALWGVPLGRRLCPDVPAGVWPQATCGLLGLGSRALGPLVGEVAAPDVLEHFAGAPRAAFWLVIFGLLGWAPAARRTWRRARSRTRTQIRDLPWCTALLPVALGAPWAMMPPWALDESLYHLSFSLHGIFAGHVWAPQGHGNGGFFALGDHIAQLGLWMGSMSAARGAQIWGVVWCGVALRALQPQLTARQVAVAQGLFVTSPVVLWQLGTAYVDITQASFELVALALWARGARERSAGTWPFNAALLCGWLCGCAIGCKVTALVWLPLGALALVRMARRSGRLVTNASGPAWPRGWPLMLAAATCAPFAADVAHNLQRYHTPLFPFGAPLWPGGETLTAGQLQALHAFLALHGPRFDGLPLEGMWRYVALPWALVFGADFASPRFDGVVGVVPIVWFAACMAVWWAARGRGAQARCARVQLPAQTRTLVSALHLFAAVRVAVWLCTSLQARFLIAPLWALAWATAALYPAAVGASQHGPRAAGGRAAVAAFLAAAVGVCCFARSLEGHMPPVQAFSTFGLDVSGRHQARLRAVPASRLCDAVPSGPTSKVMLVWSQRLSLFCLGHQHADSYDEAATLEAMLTAAGGNPAAAAALLRASGISHMIVHEGHTREAFGRVLWPQFVALRAHALQPLAAVGPQVLYALTPSAPPLLRP